MRQFNKKNGAYSFYLIVYLVPPKKPHWYWTQVLGVLLHAAELGHAPAAGSSVGYPASARLSCGFPGASGGKDYENQAPYHCVGFNYSLLAYFLLLWLLPSLLGFLWLLQ